MTTAKDTILEKHRETARVIAQVLEMATDNGTLDELAAFVSPDIINAFCDAIGEMSSCH